MSHPVPKHAIEFEHAGRHFACWESHAPGDVDAASGESRTPAAPPQWLVSVDDAAPVAAFPTDRAGREDRDRFVALVREWFDARQAPRSP